MKFTTRVAAVLAFSGFISSATAADVVLEAAAPYNWTGFYAGGQVGYHWGQLDFVDCVGLCPTDPDIEGAGLAIQAGYDHQFSNDVVLGGFISVPLSGPEGSFELGRGLEFTYEPKYAFIAGARLGYAMGGILPYVTAGYVLTKVEVTSPFDTTDSNTHHGYRIGFGTEFMVTEHLSVDLRYIYNQLDRKPYDFGGGVSRWSHEGSTISTSINWRF